MKVSRRVFLRSVPAVAAALALPMPAPLASAACLTDDILGSAEVCGTAGEVLRPAGDPGFESWWVRTHLPTKAWPTPVEIENPLSEVSEGRLFRVDGPQLGYRLPVWNPRTNQEMFIGAEAVGPVEAPFWAAFADDGRWMEVNLTPLQHVKAMQGEDEIFRDLVTAGLQGMTEPGFYRITRRVFNETMDSRTDPTIRATYRVENVLYTQYFHGNGSAIHYNWWGPPRGFGYPGSQGCLGMRMNGAKYLWDWANIGTPLVIHY